METTDSLKGLVQQWHS